MDLSGVSVSSPSQRLRPADRRNSLTAVPPAVSLRAEASRPNIGIMHLDLTDDEAAALTQELHDIVENDRYHFSPRIRTLRAILTKLRPEPVRGVETHPSRKCANKFGAKTKIGHQLSARSRQTFILPNC
jgi:hypothetical protein